MDFNRLTFFHKMFIEKEENLLELREIKFDKDNTIVPSSRHWHKAVEFIIPKTSTLKLTVNKQEIILHRNEVGMVPTRVKHSVEIVESDPIVHTLILDVDPALLQALLQDDYPLLMGFKMSKENQKPIVDYIDKMHEAYKRDGTLSSIGVLGNLMLLLDYMVQSKKEQLIQKRTSKNYDETEMNRIIQFLKKQRNKVITEEDLMFHLSLSENYMNNLIWKFYKMSTSDFIYYVKTKQSLIDLKHVNMPIKEVAASNGFKDVNQYSKFFSRFFDLTPEDFRFKYGNPEPVLQV